jgi:MFS family permease
MEDRGSGSPWRSRWRTHRTWIVPVVCVPLSYLVFGLLGSALMQLSTDTGDGWWSVVGLLALLAAFVVPVVAAVVAIRRGYRVHRSWRRSRGHLTATERAAQEHEDSYRRAWDHASHLRAALIRRELPPEIPMWAVVPRQGERFFLDGPLTYSRYYGTDVAYSHSTTVAFGRPAWVAGAMIGSAIGNSIARSRAAAAAATQWREHQLVQVVVSNQRIVCNVGGVGWLSFDHGAVTAIYPDPEHFNIVLEFGGVAAPMSLTGPMAPALATIAVLMTLGPEALGSHPALRGLLA